jgi:hypothetical protein
VAIINTKATRQINTAKPLGTHLRISQLHIGKNNIAAMPLKLKGIKNAFAIINMPTINTNVNSFFIIVVLVVSIVFY